MAAALLCCPAPVTPHELQWRTRTGERPPWAVHLFRRHLLLLLLLLLRVGPRPRSTASPSRLQSTAEEGGEQQLWRGTEG